jgi:hypothetical protein
MILAVWLLSLPFRLLAALGLRRSVIVACLFVLAVTAYGVAEDLGVLDSPVRAAPAPKRGAGQPSPTRAATADIPAGYLRLYQTAGARYRVPWPVLAAIGKVESDHGRVHLPGVRSGSNWAGACGPMQLGCVPGSKAGNAWARYGHGRPTTRHRRSRPPPATWSTTAPATTSAEPSTPTTTPGPTWPRSRPSPVATPPQGVGSGERPDRLAPGRRAGLDQATNGGLLRTLRGRAGPPPQCRPGPAGRPPPALPGLWHPQRGTAPWDDQPGRRPRPRPRPAGARGRPPLATRPSSRSSRPTCWKEVNP